MSYRRDNKPVLLHRGRNRKRRPKTFKTEEAARKWAEEKGLKDYKIVNMKNSGSKKSKFRIVREKK